MKGKGKEYYKNGKLKFEGEYLNGKRNGKGKEYDSNGHLIFEGEYSYGTIYGEGKLYYPKYHKLFLLLFFRLNILLLFLNYF